MTGFFEWNTDHKPSLHRWKSWDLLSYGRRFHGYSKDSDRLFRLQCHGPQPLHQHWKTRANIPKFNQCEQLIDKKAFSGFDIPDLHKCRLVLFFLKWTYTQGDLQSSNYFFHIKCSFYRTNQRNSWFIKHLLRLSPPAGLKINHN